MFSPESAVGGHIAVGYCRINVVFHSTFVF